MSNVGFGIGARWLVDTRLSMAFQRFVCGFAIAT
jgi:hypothetical protein